MRNIWSSTARSTCQTKIINFLRSFVYSFWRVVWLVMDTAAKRLTSVLNMTRPISKVAWKKHPKAIRDTAVNVSNKSMKKATLEVKKTSNQQHFIHTEGWFITKSYRSKRKCWWPFVSPGVSTHLFWKNWKSNWCQSENKLFKTCSNIKVQKDAGCIYLSEYLEKFSKYEGEWLLTHDGSSAVSVHSYILFVIL